MIAIREMTSKDFADVAEIYTQGIATGNATFEKSGPAKWEDFAAKYLELSRSVATIDDQVVAWAALSAVSARIVYSGVCEVSVYVHSSYRGKGIAKTLLQHLIEISEANNIWTLQAGIFPENKASIKVHLDLGFRVVGSREKIGKLDGVWRDTLLLERRSAKPELN